MSSALNPTRASRSAASTDACAAAAPAQGRLVATVVTAVLQDSMAVATVRLGRPPVECRIQAGSGCVGRPPK